MRGDVDWIGGSCQLCHGSLGGGRCSRDVLDEDLTGNESAAAGACDGGNGYGEQTGAGCEREQQRGAAGRHAQ